MLRTVFAGTAVAGAVLAAAVLPAAVPAAAAAASGPAAQETALCTDIAKGGTFLGRICVATANGVVQGTLTFNETGPSQGSAWINACPDGSPFCVQLGRRSSLPAPPEFRTPVRTDMITMQPGTGYAACGTVETPTGPVSACTGQVRL